MPLTVAQLTSQYEDRLLPPLPPGPGVCSVCATSVAGPDVHCWQCSQQRDLPARADSVAVIALAVKHSPFAYDLGAYKSGADEEASGRLQRRLAAVLWRWLSGHEHCLAHAAGVGGQQREHFELVTVVPSLRGRAGHPLRDMLSRQVAPTLHRYRDLLVPARLAGCAVAGGVQGRSVLLVDDTWTSGRHAQQAAGALKLAGAGPVAVLALGRHFSLEQPAPHGTAARWYLERARRRGWSWQHCRRC